MASSDDNEPRQAMNNTNNTENPMGTYSATPYASPSSLIDGYNQAHADTPFLGRIAWYSVRDVPIAHDTLVQALDNAGLKEFAPRPPSDVDIFRRATKAGETTIDQGDGTTAKILVRDVASDKERILRRVVIETVDGNNVRLDYSEAYDLEYRRETGQFVTSRRTWTDTPADGAVLDIQHKVATWTAAKMHGSEALRTVLKQVMEKNQGILVRPTGGVYFMPRTNDDALSQAQAFASGREQVTLHTLPLVDTPEQAQMVEDGLTSTSLKAADEMMRELAEMLRSDGSVTESKLARIVSESKRIRARVQEYKSLLDLEATGADDRLHLLDSQVQACLLKMKVAGG